MKNRIIYVSGAQADRIEKRARRNKNIYFVQIDGAKIETEEQYVRAISDAFGFPPLPKYVLGWHDDYMSHLGWIDEREIVMIIRNFNTMLLHEPQIKKWIIQEYTNVTLPWWEGELIGHMVDGVPKKFNIYICE